MNSTDVFNLRREGKPREALDLARSLMQAEPGNIWNARALAWTLFDGLKSLAVDAPGDADRARLLAVEFLRDALPKLTLPATEFSCFVGCLCPFAEKVPELGHILLHAGVGAFSPEDAVRRPGREGQADFPSLLEKVTQALHKLLSKGQKPLPLAQASNARVYLETFLGHLANHEERYQDNVWFGYWKGTLLKAVDRPEDALAGMKRVVLEKSQDFWAWEQYALFHPPESAERLHALCRARVCRAREEYTVSLRLHLAEALAAQGRPEAARAELAELHRIRQDHGWKDTPEAMALERNLGEGAATPLSADEMRALADGAEQDLVPAEDWLPAVALPPVRNERQDLLQPLTLNWRGRPLTLRVPVRRFPLLNRLKPGDPVQVVAEEQDRRVFVRMLRPSTKKVSVSPGNTTENTLLKVVNIDPHCQQGVGQC